jgi:abequosyltransferase
LENDSVRVANLAVSKERASYLAAGQNTEALFSFMGTLVVRRAAWLSVPDPLAFRGSCWEHVARLLEIARKELRLCFTGEVWLDKRGENDSFSDQGRVKRIGLAVNGYGRIASTFFGSSSVEALHVRRFLRAELKLPELLSVKRLASEHPEREDLAELGRLVDHCYCDFSPFNEGVRLLFHACPPQLTTALSAGYLEAAGLRSRAGKLFATRK